MENHEKYTIEKFMDKNFTKPHKIRVSVYDFVEICNEVDKVLSEISNLDNYQTGFNDLLYRFAVIEVDKALSKYHNSIKYKQRDECFDMTLNVDTCLFLLDILSVEDKTYSTAIRIFTGQLDSIISKNEFSAKFSLSNQILEDLEKPNFQEREIKMPKTIGEINPFANFQNGINKLSQQYG